MTVKIEYFGPNQPGSPVYEHFTDEGFVVGDAATGYVNVTPENAWFAVEQFSDMSEEDRLPLLQSVVSAVEEAHQVGHDNLDEESRTALYDDIGILFGECLRALGITAENQERLQPFTAFFELPDVQAVDAKGEVLRAA